jgi:arylsulfatase A-like enzyme
MPPRPFLVIGVVGAAGVAAAAAPRPPNIVVFVPDELRAESMGVYGHPVTSTPNFARLAADGTLFTNSFSTYPVCTQSRASFLTARYTHQAGHRTLWDPLRYWEPNLLRYAKEDAGYDVWWFGKNDALDIPSFNSSANVAADVGRSNSGTNPFPPSDSRFYSFFANATAYGVNETTDASNVARATALIEARDPSTAPPFFLYLPLMSPHPPYGCPEPYWDMYNPTDPRIPPLRPSGLAGKPDYHERIRFYRNITSWPDEQGFLRTLHALYLGCVSFTDAIFGALLDSLERSGVYNDTAIFVLSDHGDYAGDYGLVEKWPSGLEDVLLRVPTIARVPGGLRGQVADGLIQHMDITPTILDLMNVTAQHVHAGVSQLPVLLGSEAPDLDRIVFAEGGYGTLEPRDLEGDCADPLKAPDCNPGSIYYPKAYQEFHEPLTVCRSAMVRTGTHKLVRRSDVLDTDHDSELYDLAADPLELVNVYDNASYAGVRAELSEALFAWYLTTSDVIQMPFVSPYGADELPREMPSGNWTTSGGRGRGRAGGNGGGGGSGFKGFRLPRKGGR